MIESLLNFTGEFVIEFISIYVLLVGVYIIICILVFMGMLPFLYLDIRKEKSTEADKL